MKLKASCGQKIAQGGGYGDDFGFSYVYCLDYDEFVEWDSFGMAPDAQETTQHWVRARFLNADKHKRKNGETR